MGSVYKGHITATLVCTFGIKYGIESKLQISGWKMLQVKKPRFVDVQSYLISLRISLLTPSSGSLCTFRYGLAPA